MTSKKPLERDIEDECDALAVAAGFEPCKLDRLRGRRGRSDKAYLGPNNVYFQVEFKRPGEKPTRQQKHRHEQAARAGRRVIVVTSVDHFVVLLTEYVSAAYS